MRRRRSEVVEEAVQDTVDLLKEFNAISERLSQPMSDDEMSKLIERQGEIQEKLDARMRGILTPASRWPWMPPVPIARNLRESSLRRGEKAGGPLPPSASRPDIRF